MSGQGNKITVVIGQNSPVLADSKFQQSFIINTAIGSEGDVNGIKTIFIQSRSQSNPDMLIQEKFNLLVAHFF